MTALLDALQPYLGRLDNDRLVTIELRVPREERPEWERLFRRHGEASGIHWTDEGGPNLSVRFSCPAVDLFFLGRYVCTRLTDPRLLGPVGGRS